MMITPLSIALFVSLALLTGLAILHLFLLAKQKKRAEAEAQRQSEKWKAYAEEKNEEEYYG